MIKPENISRSAWDAARRATGGWMAAGEPEVNEALIGSVARAIDAHDNSTLQCAMNLAIVLAILCLAVMAWSVIS